MSKILKPRRSRRCPPLQDSDYDHEINLLDSDQASLKAAPDSSQLRQSTSGPSSSLEPSSSRPNDAEPQQATSPDNERQHGGNGNGNGKGNDSKSAQADEVVVEIQEPTPIADDHHRSGPTRKAQRVVPESAIDILYENERGGFLCGIPLFSSKALGNLDPPPWTNFAHKPSPTDISTAQVPDPSWEWAWPEWRINHDDGTDQDGWEYSFAFHKWYSWHGPKWWNSFVRRRAWIRKRVKKASGYQQEQEDPSMLDDQYFIIRPASAASHVRTLSRADTRRTSRASIARSHVTDVEETQQGELTDIESLIRALRASRIDREKIEAIDNYLEHTEDNLEPLEGEMHEIMSLFVFQTARRSLLSRLTQVYDETHELVEESKGENLEKLQQKIQHLKAAIKHADEEVKRLEYWSDVKEMVVEGDSMGAMDHKHWDEERWRGLDNSGPAEPRPPENEKS